MTKNKTIGLKEEKMIKEYVALRGKGHVEYQEQDFIQAYKEADPKQRQVFIDEMVRYKDAIDQGKIKPGDNIRQATFDD